MLDVFKTEAINIKNVSKIIFNEDPFKVLNFKLKNKTAIIFLDNFFLKKKLISKIIIKNHLIFFLPKNFEPTTCYIDDLKKDIIKKNNKFNIVVAIGGGSTLDTGKAISNILTNPGNSEKYQGWDLLKKKGIYKIGVPTIFGTGSEVTRTCVLMNRKKNLKLGMNSDFTVFDEVILSPNLSRSVNKNQYFYTGMDCYIHSLESISGNYQNTVANAYSKQAIELCKEIFLSKNMKSKHNREKLMVASFLGGQSIAMSYVGLVHPLSAALSVVYDIPHCKANCIVMRSMKNFYPEYYKLFWKFVKKQKIFVPKIFTKSIKNEDFIKLKNATLVHNKPLTNALGNKYKNILNDQTLKKLFLMM